MWWKYMIEEKEKIDTKSTNACYTMFLIISMLYTN